MTSDNGPLAGYAGGAGVLPWSASNIPGPPLLQYDRIGSDSSGVYTNGGSIAEVAIFDRALTPQEIVDLQVYAEQKWGVPLSGLTPSGGNPLILRYKIEGNVKDIFGDSAARLVAAFRRDSFELAGTATSDDLTGNYKISVVSDEEHVVIGVPDPSENRNAFIWDRVIPVTDI